MTEITSAGAVQESGSSFRFLSGGGELGALIREFATGCDVGMVGSSHLATYAEAELSGNPAADDAIKTEIAPCFVDADEEFRRCLRFLLLHQKTIAYVRDVISYTQIALA